MISKIIHSVWFSGDARPEAVQSCMSRIKEVNGGYELRLWTLADIFHHLTGIPAFFHEAAALKRWAFATDWARLAILERFGGIYLDSDVMCHKPFDHLLDSPGFISWESRELLGPHCLGAEAGHPLIRDWLSLYQNRRFQLTDWVTDQTPMPTVITDFSTLHHGLRRDGWDQRIAGGFRVHTADVLTSDINGRCVAEHLYHGGWLHHQDGSFAAGLRRDNARFLGKPRSIADRLMAAAGRNPIEIGYGKRSIAEQKKTLCLVDPVRRSLPGISFWHVGAVRKPRLTAGPAASEPRVSVIVPAAAASQHTDRTLRSLAHQTYRNLEIVIVHHGAKDAAWPTCEGHASQNGNVALFHQDGGGRGAACNLGLEKISGDLVCFVDAGDTVAPGHAEALVRECAAGADVAVCGHEEAGAEGPPFTSGNSGRPGGGADPVLQLLLTDAGCFAWNKMFRRGLFEFEPFRFGPGPSGELAFVPAVLGCVESLSFSQTVTYRRQPGSASSPGMAALDPDATLGVIEAARHLIRLEPVFRPDYWSGYYDWKLVEQILYARWPDLQLITGDLERAECQKRLAGFVNSEIPWWFETAFVKSMTGKGSIRSRLAAQRFVRDIRRRGG